MSPLIYFSYGMTKSGSTLSYELARSAFVLAGFAQHRLSTRAVENRKHINFCEHINKERADAIRSEVSEIGHPIAIKTHTRPDPEVVKMLQNNDATAHATYRDPRDIALSMVDHGARARRNNEVGFTEIRTVDDAIDNIKHQTNSLLAWLSLPNVRPIYYDDVAFNMKHTTTKLVSDLGLSVNLEKVLQMGGKDRFTQKNKAVRERYKADMSEETSERFLQIFAPMYERLILKRHDLPDDGSPVLDPQLPLCDWSQTTSIDIGRNS